MSDYVTDEIVETAARAEWDQYKPDLDGGPWAGLTEAQRASWREGVEVVLAAAIPLVTPAIKAEALRDAAEEIDLSPSYPTPGLSELHNAEAAAEAYLGARADQIEKEDA